MATVNLVNIAANTALDPAVVKGNFDQLSGAINGQLGPENLKTSQIHVPFFATCTMGAGTAFVFKRPVDVASGSVLLTKCVFYGQQTVGASTLDLVVTGHTSLANALAGAGSSAITSANVNGGAGLGIYGAETTPGLDVSGAGYAYWRIVCTPNGGSTWVSPIVSGEIVYTIQAV